MTRFSVGWEEWLALPELGLPAVKAKVDTGAKTSALHAFAIEPFGPADRPMVRFAIHPDPDDAALEIICSAPLKDRREVTSSNGETELRFVIETVISMGEHSWPIEVTLTDRGAMAYRMLLGRTALTGDVQVMPALSFQQPVLSFDAYRSFPRGSWTKRALRMALLTREPENYSNRRLIAAAEERGHSVEVIDTSRCYMKIQGVGAEVHYDGRKLPHFDAIIPRIGASITSYGTSVVRQFESTGTYCLSGSEGISISRDKLHAHQVLARHRIGMPDTAFARSPKDSKNLINLVGDAPVILKLLESAQGKGVVLAETRKAAESVISAFRGLKADFLVQHFVKEAAGEDIRCIVLGGKVVAAMRRQGPPGEFRSNLHQGGSAQKVRITKQERETALKAARAMRLEFAGVDLLRSEGGPKVLEVNSSPGLEGIEKTTGKDIAAQVIEHIEKQVAPKLPRTKRRK
ncbi:Ribosomal protein S6--L-glutamate ligase [Aliiroseovarius sp. xm-m-379]|uniref:30S ribosomal protein S6--L-glutamate ligase n=1 Tax=unclassified Aliiroseovarius TaxID=2623558 RepID=UPI00156A5CA2|nr:MULTISPECIES: 30S ribosomal protein S6--L-glutamate ligase [unclassified Aliiroseovarius]NRP14251.1 Ribosomal protein S6--L-glutamate ligase [Aliiroseovarius sp. xm-d-517]NRP23735.1 Ribosomal protein S6--L-glutamate ligase [Aliiroseovarius sp. xm-m-379]NRP29018.1 Ribosomal protein S6--L-glutamate ligase [Aliiroseovarius sp. xm-m-314]NRP32534.1 Ribosomal protein S6--L-glutamate ligase [Aliiroseovarius sp. xm-a-104]NRP41067.1 Ribosomal protein S6--L-glutamate ligase [Aliiroseovarius sp. xm-m-